MKLLTYRHAGLLGVGFLDASSMRIVPLDDDQGHPILDMLQLIRGGLENVQPSVLREPMAMVDVQLLAPIPRPARNILCVGRNYPRGHATTTGDAGNAALPDRPSAPIVFTKAPETVIADGDFIRYPPITDALDYEAELAVVIGRGGHAIERADAMAHVFGYTIINDVTARDLQHRHQQWFLGKSMDTFCPMGPYLVTADEVDAGALELRCHVNGELRQLASTADLIFDVAQLIETISSAMTLYPGDIIATGTPEGFGAGFDPPRFLQSGDEIRISISSIGELSNTVF